MITNDAAVSRKSRRQYEILSLDFGVCNPNL